MGQDRQRRIALCLSHRLDRDGQHGRVEGRFLIQDEPANPGCQGYRNPHAGEVINGWFLQDLVVPASYRRDTPEKTLWAYPDVLVYRRRLPVGLETAKEIVRTLAKVERGLARLREAEGFIHDHIAFLFRLAGIFAAKVVVPADAGALTPWSFIEMTPDDLADQIRRWQAE
jgi:hypothetical protein